MSSMFKSSNQWASDDDEWSYDAQDAYFDCVETFTRNTIKRYPELERVYHTTGGWTSVDSEGEEVHMSVNFLLASLYYHLPSDRDGGLANGVLEYIFDKKPTCKDCVSSEGMLGDGWVYCSLCEERTRKRWIFQGSADFTCDEVLTWAFDRVWSLVFSSMHSNRLLLLVTRVVLDRLLAPITSDSLYKIRSVLSRTFSDPLYWDRELYSHFVFQRLKSQWTDETAVTLKIEQNLSILQSDARYA